jgi:hypothetical protein
MINRASGRAEAIARAVCHDRQFGIVEERPEPFGFQPLAANAHEFERTV